MTKTSASQPKLRIDARRFLRYTTEELIENLEGDFTIVFRDGELDVNERSTIYSSFVWDFHRKYPDTPMLMMHHVAHAMGSKELKAGAHLDLINKVLWTVHDAYVDRVPDARELRNDLGRMAYLTANNMYNTLTLLGERYVTSLDITDFVAVTTHPAVDQAMADMPHSEEGIAQTYKLIEDLINKDPAFANNPLAVAIRTGIARKQQALQCVGPRGYLTDIDSKIFTAMPVTTGYVQGVRSLPESMFESRSAAKSLINATKPLQESEYFSRRQQLICMNVKRLHPGDCGSQEYVLWPIRGVRKKGEKSLRSDLETLVGKKYLDEASGQLKVIRESDTHLIGQTIRLRSCVSGCAHPDPYGICETCYGEGSLAIPANSNLGHIACVNMTALIGQNILSTKHFDGSSVVEGIILGPLEAQYLKATANGSSFYLSDRLKNQKVRIAIPTEQASGVPDLKLVNTVEELNISRVSEFAMIDVIVPLGPDVEETIPLKVFVNNRHSSMSHDFLRHVKKNGYTITGKGKYEIDMAGWDFSLPMFVLPMDHFNMSNHQNEIASMLEATADDLEKRSAVVDPKAMLIEFHDLVNERLVVNLASLEIILFSSMVVSAVENNYDLPKPPRTRSGVGVMRLLLSNRSGSAQMGFQNHHNFFADPSSYVQKERLDHIYDGIVMPELFNTSHKFLSGT